MTNKPIIVPIDKEFARTLANQRRNPTTMAGEKFEKEYRETVCTEKHVANSDNKYLEPLKAGPNVMGCVDEVNGEGAREIPEFNGTHHELMQLVKYWARMAIESEWFVFVTNSIRSRDLRVRPFAQRRIDRIAALVGREEVERTVNDVEIEFSTAQDPEQWELFLNRTSQEQSPVQVLVEVESKDIKPERK